MAVSHLEVTRRTPFPFDYERIDGIVHFAVDPLHQANAGVVDLDKAARDAHGLVHFDADFVLLQPTNPGKSNRRLLSYVVNRGLRVGVPFNRFPPRSPTLPPTDEIDAGDGFLMQRGWSVAFCGWQWDVERVPGLTGLRAPQALGPDGKPISGKIAIAFQANEDHPYHRLAHWPLHPAPGRQALWHQPYPAADLDESTAELTVRDTASGTPRVIPRDQWRFATDDGPDDSHIRLDGNFKKGHWYQVIYTTRVCPVVGTGLLAIRDSTAWLHHASDSPTGGRIDFTYANGRSQCGRFLRQFVYEGFNLDEQGRKVFDGLLPHVAGARRGEFNQRYGQPSETAARWYGGLFPFASDEQTDPVTGQTDGLLTRQRQLGGVPRIFTTNTSSEYWRSDCSLIHTDPAGTRDLEPPDEERIYLVAGHEHGSGLPQQNNRTPIGALGANNFNVVDGVTVIRAFLINLDRWCAEGVEPPPSAFPRLADGTAVPREQVLQQLSALPGLTTLEPSLLPRLRRLDISGPPPASLGDPYPSFAPAVDTDGNEIAGIRLPDLTVPVATNTGWVSRHADIGGAGQVLDMMGASLPFAATAADRAAHHDPRSSIEERYRDRDDYAARARRAAEELAAQRYIVAEDVDVVVELALERYDLFARQPAGVS